MTLLQSEIDIAIPSTTPAQQLLAWVVIAIGIVVVAWRIYATHYAGLPARLTRAKADLRGARQDTRLTTAYLAAAEAEDRATVRETVTEVLAGEAAADVRPRDAARSIRDELAATWAPHWLRLPATARRVVTLALLITVFGAIAVSTEVLLGVFETTTPGVQPARWPILAVSETAAVVDRALTLAGTVPIVGSALSVAFQLALTLGTLIYPYWYAVAAVLVAGALAVTRLDRRVGSVDGQWVTDLPAPGSVARGGAAVGFLLWVVTLVGIGLGRMVGPPQLGVRYGLAAALGATAVLVAVGAASAKRHADHLPALGNRWRAASASERTYLAVRGATLTVAAIAGPLVPVYVAVAISKLPRLVRGFLGASLGIQALVALVTLGVAGVLAWQAREAWGDVQSAVQITLARQQVRAFAVGAGIPIAVVGVTYTLVAGLSKSILLGVVVAVAAGLLARTALSLLTRVRYRMGLRDPRDQPARRVVLEGATLETRDGDRQHYLRINGSTELLHPDEEQVRADAARVAQQLVTDGEADRPLSDWHAEFAFDYGVVDGEETEQKLVERPRRQLYHQLREHGGRVPVERLDEEIADIPERYLDGLLWREEYERGAIRTTDDYVVLRSDPYA